ncbi:MAG: hypothetical protein ABI693_02205 [Bryobacteraceae bacterium]
MRVSNRNRNEPTNRNNNIGFRCAGDGKRASRPFGAPSWASAGIFMEIPGVLPSLPGRYPDVGAAGVKQQPRPGLLVAEQANVSPGRVGE